MYYKGDFMKDREVLSENAKLILRQTLDNFGELEHFFILFAQLYNFLTLSDNPNSRILSF